MSVDTSFGQDLEELVGRVLKSGGNPEDIAEELSRRLNILIDQHNLEFQFERKNFDN